MFLVLFKLKMKRLIKEQRKSTRFNHVIHMMRRTATILLIVATISFSCLMTVDAYREKFIEIVTHVFHEVTDYRFSAETSNSRIETELGAILPCFMPDGLDKADKTFYTVSYENEDGTIIFVIS